MNKSNRLSWGLIPRFLSLLTMTLLSTTFVSMYAPILEYTHVFVYDFTGGPGTATSAANLKINDSLLSLKLLDPCVTGSKSSRVVNVEVLGLDRQKVDCYVTVTLEGSTDRDTDFFHAVPGTVVFDTLNNEWVTIEDLEPGAMISGFGGTCERDKSLYVIGKSIFYVEVDSIKIITDNPGFYFIQSNKNNAILIKSDTCVGGTGVGDTLTLGD